MAITDQPREDDGASAIRAPLRLHRGASRVRALPRPHTIAQLVRALGPSATPEAVATPVVRAVRALFNADGCALLQIDDRDARRLASEPPNADVESFLGGPAEMARDLSPSGHMLGPTSDEGAENHNGCVMTAAVGAPEDPLAIVAVWRSGPPAYTHEDADYLHEQVQALAPTLAYARGLAHAARRADRLERMNRALAALGHNDPDEAAGRFLRECRLLIGAEHAGALRFDLDAEVAHILAYDSEVLARERVQDDPPLSWFRLNSLLSDPRPSLIHDIREEGDLPHYAALLVNHGFYSVLQIPLMLRGELAGVVSFWGRGARRFSEDDAQLVMTLAGPFAVALERTMAVESLAESEARYRSLVAQAEEMIVVVEAETRRLLEVNPHTAEFLGYAPGDLLNRHLHDILAADATGADPLALTATQGSHELRFRRRDGIELDVDVVVSPLTVAGREAVLLLGRDASARKSLQRQLIQGQKMESLGTMAGAVAHDFNNLLTTILGFAGLLKRSPALQAEDRENLGLIEDAAHRAADLTGRLLSFARGGLVRFGPLDLKQVVEDTLRLAEPTMHDRLHLSVDISQEPLLIEGDGGQVHQALLNIVLNARDAMPTGGDISVSLQPDGDHAVIVIADDGPGMDEETRTRIFEPFFTTKPAGSGTGLGMAITYGIVQGHHGSITVDSAPGRGTRFTIRLPRLTPRDVPTVITDPGEGNLVLVVDDDEMVRRATTATLWQLGYSVAASPGGEVAVELVRARPERFSAVILDLVMPGMTGSDTFHAISALRADIPVIVCTGFAADKHIDEDVMRRIAGLVRKPFTSDDLAGALRAAGVKPQRRRG